MSRFNETDTEQLNSSINNKGVLGVSSPTFKQAEFTAYLERKVPKLLQTYSDATHATVAKPWLDDFLNPNVEHNFVNSFLDELSTLFFANSFDKKAFDTMVDRYALAFESINKIASARGVILTAAQTYTREKIIQTFACKLFNDKSRARATTPLHLAIISEDEDRWLALTTNVRITQQMLQQQDDNNDTPILAAINAGIEISFRLISDKTNAENVRKEAIFYSRAHALVKVDANGTAGSLGIENEQGQSPFGLITSIPQDRYKTLRTDISNKYLADDTTNYSSQPIVYTAQPSSSLLSSTISLSLSPRAKIIMGAALILGALAVAACAVLGTVPTGGGSLFLGIKISAEVAALGYALICAGSAATGGLLIYKGIKNEPVFPLFSNNKAAHYVNDGSFVSSTTTLTS